MGIKILTDSASDIPQDLDENIVVLPLHVTFGKEEYLDGVNLSHEDFYKKLIECDTLPKTSQMPPFAYSEAFEKATASGDQLIVITLAASLSGTWQNARIAAEDFPGKVFVVDSKSVTLGQRALVTYARHLLDQNLTAEEIVAELEVVKDRIQIIALLDTLEYLKKGGRIPKTVAAFGEMLSIKPVVSLAHGEVAILGKAHGSKNGNRMLNDSVQKVGGVDFDMPCFLGYTGLSDSQLQKYINSSRSFWGDRLDCFEIMTGGGMIGTHVGPGAIAVSFFAKNSQ